MQEAAKELKIVRTKFLRISNVPEQGGSKYIRSL